MLLFPKTDRSSRGRGPLGPHRRGALDSYLSRSGQGWRPRPIRVKSGSPLGCRESPERLAPTSFASPRLVSQRSLRRIERTAVSKSVSKPALRDDVTRGSGLLPAGLCGGQGRGRTADLPIFRPKEPVRGGRPGPSSCSAERNLVPCRPVIKELVLANPLANRSPGEWQLFECLGRLWGVPTGPARFYRSLQRLL